MLVDDIIAKAQQATGLADLGATLLQPSHTAAGTMRSNVASSIKSVSSRFEQAHTERDCP